MKPGSNTDFIARLMGVILLVTGTKLPDAPNRLDWVIAVCVLIGIYLIFGSLFTEE